MVKKVLKWIGIVLGSLLGLIVLAAVALYASAGARLNRTYTIQPEAITIPTDEAAIERGQHLAEAICTACHGEDLSGQVFLDDPAVGRVYASNLTTGRGGVGTYSDAELVLAIRHGVGRNGRPLVIMPAEIFINWSAEDLGAVIAYLRTIPPIDNEIPEPELTFMGRVLLTAGLLGKPFPAEYIDHDKPFPPMPPVGANKEYGQYLASAAGCTLCHGPDLAGGVVPPNAPPGRIPPSANLTPAGQLAHWSEADFIQTLRTGVTPDGHQIDPEVMPWEIYTKLYNDELSALWLYLQSLPVKE